MSRSTDFTTALISRCVLGTDVATSERYDKNVEKYKDDGNDVDDDEGNGDSGDGDGDGDADGDGGRDEKDEDENKDDGSFTKTDADE